MPFLGPKYVFPEDYKIIDQVKFDKYESWTKKALIIGGIVGSSFAASKIVPMINTDKPSNFSEYVTKQTQYNSLEKLTSNCNIQSIDKELLNQKKLMELKQQQSSLEKELNIIITNKEFRKYNQTVKDGFTGIVGGLLIFFASCGFAMYYSSKRNEQMEYKSSRSNSQKYKGLI